MNPVFFCLLLVLALTGCAPWQDAYARFLTEVRAAIGGVLRENAPFLEVSVYFQGYAET